MLKNKSYRVGKALDNDIVLLDAETPAYLATIDARKMGYVLENKNDSIKLGAKNINIGRYQVRLVQHQHWVWGLVFVFVFSISLLFFSWMGLSELPKNHHMTLPARGVYGDQTKMIESLKFDFQTKEGGFSVLHYTSGNLESSDQLQILINNRFLSYALASPRTWNLEQSLYIPKDFLKQGTNQVEFTFLGNKPWAIRNIYIEELEKEPNQPSTDDLIRSAEKLYRERKARKGNLVRAQQVLFRASQSFKRSNEVQSSRFIEILHKVEIEKNQMIRDHQLLIQKYRTQGETKKASKVYQKLLDELVDPLDLDRRNFETEMGTIE